jgi:hypothetical protein
MTELSDEELDAWIEVNVMGGCLHKNQISHNEIDSEGYYYSWNTCVDCKDIVDSWDSLPPQYSSSISCAFSLIKLLEEELKSKSIVWRINQIIKEEELFWVAELHKCYDSSIKGSFNKSLSRAVCEEVYKWYNK